ncbi:MAG TPA: magnesium transporter [Pseudolabrys sp.]|nr:magnesium transporter [Pseudolabrys sp.]
MQDDLTLDAPLPDPVQEATRLLKFRPADIVEILNDRDFDDAAAPLRHMPVDTLIEIFDQPELFFAEELILKLPEDLAASILSRMSFDRATDIFHEMPEADATRMLRRLDPEARSAIEQLLAYPPNTAGALMTTEFVSVPSDWTAAQTLDYIRKVERTRETIYAIYVCDPHKRTLLRAVSLRRLITADPSANILTVARDATPITAPPTMDREDVARLITKHDLLAIPVVNRAYQVLGIVTVDDIIDAIIAEGTEDVQKFGGVTAFETPYMQVGFGEMLYKRAGWLGILFLGEMLTASAMQHFADELAKAVVLTLFIPLIMSSGGNSGSQATSLLIRALALGDVKLRDWWRIALRELPTGLTLGAFLGVIGVARITIWQVFGLYDYGEHWILIAVTVGAALIGIVGFGSLIGSMLPFILKGIGFDPASASAPFVATFVDVTGLVIYFSVALFFLRGTLL